MLAVTKVFIALALVVTCCFADVAPALAAKVTDTRQTCVQHQSPWSSGARFPCVETALEQLVQDPIREFFGSTLGPTIFGLLIHCCLCRSLLVLIPNSCPMRELDQDPDQALALASTSSI